MARVFAGTNVLFPFSTMDLLLALTEDMVHEVIWTESSDSGSPQVRRRSGKPVGRNRFGRVPGQSVVTRVGAPACGPPARCGQVVTK